MTSKISRSPDVLTHLLQAVICGTGLAGGLVTGSVIVYASGLWNEVGRVLGKPIDNINKMDLFFAAAPFAVMFGCVWLGTRWGIRLAAKIQN